MRSVCMKNFGNTFDRTSRFCSLPRLVPGNQHMDVAAKLLRRGDGVECRLLDRLVVVLGDDENAHITFASLRSLSTSAFTSATFIPALRFDGSTTFTVLSLGATSTPRPSGLRFSSVFFFAFMMFGSVT